VQGNSTIPSEEEREAITIENEEQQLPYNNFYT
jgi:hypothetical protein